MNFQKACRERGNLLLKVLLAVALVVPVWCVPYPPLQDYPNHLARAYIALHLYDPTKPFTHYYTLVPYPVPNSLSDFLLLALGRFMPLNVAGKLLLSLLLIGFPLSFERFLASVRPRDSALYGLFGWVLAYNHFFHRGYLNYLLGLTCVFLCLWAYTRLWITSKWSDALLVAFLTVLTFLAHLLAFTILTLLVALALLDRRPGRQNTLLSVPGFLLSGLLFLLYWTGEHPPLSFATYPSLKLWATALAQTFFAYDPPRDLLTIAPVLGLWLGLLLLRLKDLLRLDIWLAAGFLLFLVALAMPRNINIMVRPGQRLLLVALLVAIAGFPRLPQRPALFVRTFLVLMTLIVSLRVAMAYVALQPELQQIVTCVRGLTPGVPTGHVVLTPYRGSIQPEKHIAEYAALWKDTPVSNLFTSYSLLHTSLPTTMAIADLDPVVYPQAVIVGPPVPPPRGYVETLCRPHCTVWQSAGR